MTTDGRTGLNVLDVEECFDLLGTQSLGRLAYVVDGAPKIMPLNYALYQGSVVFRTGYGDVLDLLHRRQVAFEVDNGDPTKRTGWSVIVAGVAEEISNPAELELVGQLPLRPWAPGHRDHYVRILSTAVTGRRID